MAKTPKEPLTTIHFLAPPTMLNELNAEQRRTGLSRTALIKLAWLRYVESRQTVSPNLGKQQ